MTDAPIRLDLKLVDENFKASPASPTADKLKANAAAAIREGRLRERRERAADTARLEATHAGHVAGVKEAHAEELKRISKLIAKAAFREGGLIGLVIGMALSAALISGTWLVVKDAVLLNTATARVGRSIEAGPVPNLTQSYQDAEPATGEPIRRIP